MKALKAGILALALAATAYSADGATLFKKYNCHTCHGEGGKQPISPAYPKLNGQNAQYMIQQLKDIKSGKRSNGLSAVMKGMISAMSDKEFETVAKYLEAVK